ncbi:MAG: hypothetical protein AAGI07_03525 [Bacteroidota bacterium]
MIKPSLILIVIFVLSQGFHVANFQNCNRFKVGNFIYFQQDKNTYNKNLLAVRTTDQQINIDKEKGDTLVYDLTWTTPCHYQLILKSSNVKSVGLIQVGDTINVSLQPVNRRIFTYQSTFEKSGESMHFEGKMRKVK